MPGLLGNLTFHMSFTDFLGNLSGHSAAPPRGVPGL